MQELNPNKFLDGLGPIRWLWLMLRTRAATISRCDALVDTLVRHLDVQEGELRALRQIAAFMPEQHNALLIARDALSSVDAFVKADIIAIRHTIDSVVGRAENAL